MSFLRVLEKYRKISFNEKDKGTRFKRLMQASDSFSVVDLALPDTYNLIVK